MPSSYCRGVCVYVHVCVWERERERERERVDSSLICLSLCYRRTLFGHWSAWSCRKWMREWTWWWDWPLDQTSPPYPLNFLCLHHIHVDLTFSYLLTHITLLPLDGTCLTPSATMWALLNYTLKRTLLFHTRTQRHLPHSLVIDMMSVQINLNTVWIQCAPVSRLCHSAVSGLISLNGRASTVACNTAIEGFFLFSSGCPDFILSFSYGTLFLVASFITSELLLVEGQIPWQWGQVTDRRTRAKLWMQFHAANCRTHGYYTVLWNSVWHCRTERREETNRKLTFTLQETRKRLICSHLPWAVFSQVERPPVSCDYSSWLLQTL